jgi:hypothetical protein
MEECSNLGEHYPGYRKDVLDVVTDILALERQRAWQNISIQKKIGDKIEAAGEHFVKMMPAPTQAGETG